MIKYYHLTMRKVPLSVLKLTLFIEDTQILLKTLKNLMWLLYTLHLDY